MTQNLAAGVEGGNPKLRLRARGSLFPQVLRHVDEYVETKVDWRGQHKSELGLERYVKSAKNRVAAYVKNDHLEFTIPYEFLGAAHAYCPDFIVRLMDGSYLVLEVKGQQTPQDDAKHQAARRWVGAINRWGQLGRWDFAVCNDPQMLVQSLIAGRAA